MTHDEIWSAIDGLAARHSMSVSRLAREAGLDATTFNKSKRLGTDGRPRWPSTESISKILTATQSTIGDLMGEEDAPLSARLPLIGSREATSNGFFDASGHPSGQGWDAVEVTGDDPHAFALEVSGQALEPLYTDGERLVLSPSAVPRRGDHVIARTHGGDLLARILVRRTANVVEFTVPEGSVTTFDVRDLVWMARVIWVSR